MTYVYAGAADWGARTPQNVTGGCIAWRRTPAPGPPSSVACRVLPTSPRESRFSMAYSHPYERNGTR